MISGEFGEAFLLCQVATERGGVYTRHWFTHGSTLHWRGKDNTARFSHHFALQKACNTPQALLCNPKFGRFSSWVYTRPGVVIPQ